MINEAELRQTKDVHVQLAQDHVKFDWSTVDFNPENLPSFTVMECNLLEWIKAAQVEHYASELTILQTEKTVGKRSSLCNLTPFLDDQKVLRVGGRISASGLPYEQVHPVILPPRHPMTTKILVTFYLRLHHLGVYHVLTHVISITAVVNN